MLATNQCFSHLLSCQWLFYTSNVLVLPGDCLTITGSFFGTKYGRLKQKLPICILLPIICMRFSGLALAWLHKAASTLKHNLICLASYSYRVDKIYTRTVQGLTDIMLKNSLIMQTRWHLTLCLLYCKGAGSGRLLLCLITRIRILFIPQFVSCY